MKVSEIFYSVQGEGRNLGRPSVFLRLTGCNLRCKWCDSSYSWVDGDELSVDELKAMIEMFPCRCVVLTGGEPLLQQNELTELIKRMRVVHPYYFEVETNGTIEPDEELLDLVDHWVVSPKLSNSGVAPYRVGDWLLTKVRGGACLKFVIDTEADLDEVQQYLKEHYKYVPTLGVYLMPQAITVEEHNRRLPFLIKFAKEHHYIVTPRLQILAYGNRRGV